MRNVVFYNRSAKVKPRIDPDGTVHVCVSKWTAIERMDRADEYRDERGQSPRDRSSDND